jgi:hemerythrin
MASVVWCEQLILGMPAMDEAHEALLAAMAHVNEAPDTRLGVAVQGLTDLLERHFDEEQTLMQCICYPEIQAHHDQHMRVLDMLRSAARESACGYPGPTRQAMTMLSHWFLHHLTTMDLALAVALSLSRADSAAVAAVAQAHVQGVNTSQ